MYKKKHANAYKSEPSLWIYHVQNGLLLMHDHLTVQCQQQAGLAPLQCSFPYPILLLVRHSNLQQIKFKIRDDIWPSFLR